MKKRNKLSLKNYAHPSHKWDQVPPSENKWHNDNFAWRCRFCSSIVMFDRGASEFYGNNATMSCKNAIISRIMES